jgi:hypothetical protein
LPAIVTHARIAFRHLDPEAKEEAVQEVICNVCRAVARLAELGKLDLAYPSVLASFACSQVKDGRKVGCPLNINDVLSPYCQQRKDVKVESIDHFDDEENGWREAVIVDTRSSPVPDVVAFRCDFSDWLASLPRRDCHIAESLAVGNRTSEVARRPPWNLGKRYVSILDLRRLFWKHRSRFSQVMAVRKPPQTRTHCGQPATQAAQSPRNSCLSPSSPRRRRALSSR